MGSPDCYLEVVDSVKILGLGLIVRSDMRWYDNTNSMCQKGYKRLWMLRRLKGVGASLEESKDVYIKQVRSVMELAVSVWQPALTNQEVQQIERVQKCAMAIILGNKYINYEKATEELCLENLSDRRLKLSQNFAKKAAKSPKFQNWFNEIPNRDNMTSTRSYKNKSLPRFKPIPPRTNRYKKSPLPYLTDILNELKFQKT